MNRFHARDSTPVFLLHVILLSDNQFLSRRAENFTKPKFDTSKKLNLVIFHLHNSKNFVWTWTGDNWTVSSQESMVDEALNFDQAVAASYESTNLFVFSIHLR